MLSVARAQEVMNRFAGKTVLVVGDLMLDRYVTGDVERISPEAPVPVLQIRREEDRPGGAANVAWNIQAMGGHAVVAGVVGDDADGRGLRSMLADRGIDPAAIVVSPDVRTTVKTRIVAGRQQIVRMDREAGLAAFGAAGAEVCARIEDVAAKVDGVLLEDYGKGVVTRDSAAACERAAARRAIPLGLDPKDNRAFQLSGITVATPNYKEACLAAGVQEHPLCAGPEMEARLLEIGRRLRRTWDPRLLLITLGPHGMFILGAEEAPAVIPTRARAVFDVSGAGDTVIAVTLLALVAGAGAYEAASLANAAAGVVVGKVGTASCTPAELLERMA